MMAAPRASADAQTRSPHSVSLRVLRLSRPTLSTQHPVPPVGDDASVHPELQAAPDDGLDSGFLLTPSVKLPSSFGAVHVGETFTCTLCANNELVQGASNMEISDVNIQAELQTPMQNALPISLDIEPPMSAEDEALGPGQTLQRIVRSHLSDEGNYVLFVTVSYTEIEHSSVTDGEVVQRNRSFRKMYQFSAQHLIRVRIKSRPLPAAMEKVLGRGHSVEAQLEKLGEDSIVIDAVTFDVRPAFRAKTLNTWDMEGDSSPKPSLEAGGVLQVAFLVLEASEDEVPETTKDGRAILGQLSIRWRSAMGEPGTLNTGWLTGKRS